LGANENQTMQKVQMDRCFTLNWMMFQYRFLISDIQRRVENYLDKARRARAGATHESPIPGKILMSMTSFLLGKPSPEQSLH
jgi:hypothetical protein